MQQLGHSQFLAGRGLEAPAMLGFEQMLFSEQTRRDCREAGISSTVEL
jgi:hypothetical protein